MRSSEKSWVGSFPHLGSPHTLEQIRRVSFDEPLAAPRPQFLFSLSPEIPQALGMKAELPTVVYPLSSLAPSALHSVLASVAPGILCASTVSWAF